MDQAAESHQPITITGKRHDAVLLAAEDWQAIQETLYLLSVPGMRESIKEGMAQAPDACAKAFDWRAGKSLTPSMHKKTQKV
jgi:PHD/YefM family antitoxin component YafN of YafNO toxin-antitoxin module